VARQKHVARPPDEPPTLTPPASAVGGPDATAWWMLRARPRGIDRLLSRTTGAVTGLVQLAPGTLDTRLFRLAGPTADVDGGHANLPLRSVGTTSPNRVTVTFVLACPGRCVMDGHAVTTGDALVWPVGVSYDGIAPGGYRWATVILPASTSYDLVSARSGVADGRLTLGRACMPSSVRSSVRGLLREMHAWDEPGRDAIPDAVGDAWRDRWLGLASWALRASPPAPAPGAGAANAMHLVRTAEACLLRRLASVLYVEDVCREVGVPERTLDAAFRAVLGTSPMRYLEILRAHAVFLDLRRTDADAPHTVRDAETRAGVTHGARFARRYRSVFGENPTDTFRVARAPIARGGGP